MYLCVELRQQVYYQTNSFFFFFLSFPATKPLHEHSMTLKLNIDSRLEPKQPVRSISRRLLQLLHICLCCIFTSYFLLFFCPRHQKLQFVCLSFIYCFSFMTEILTLLTESEGLISLKGVGTLVRGKSKNGLFKCSNTNRSTG